MAPPVQADQVAVTHQKILVPEIDKLLERDGYLKLHETEIRRRYLYLKIFIIKMSLISDILIYNVLFDKQCFHILLKCNF